MIASHVLDYIHEIMESEGIRSGQRIDTLLEVIEGVAHEEDAEAEDQDDEEAEDQDDEETDSDEDDSDDDQDDYEQNPDNVFPEDDPDSAD